MSFNFNFIFTLIYSSIQLRNAGIRLFGKQFRGVYALDLLPKYLPHGFYIVNSHVSTLPGEHWIAINVMPHVIKVFDSFGFFYPGPLITRLLNTGKSIRFNRVRYQKFSSSNCGELCLKWLLAQKLV